MPSFYIQQILKERAKQKRQAEANTNTTPINTKKYKVLAKESRTIKKQAELNQNQ